MASLLPQQNLPQAHLESDVGLQQEHAQNESEELVAGDVPLDQLCHSVAEDLTASLSHNLGYAEMDDSTRASHSLPPPANYRKLYLAMMMTNPGRVLEMLAIPLKQKLLQSSVGAVLLEGSRAPIKIGQGRTFASDCQVVTKEAFCIGRHKACDVQLWDKGDTKASRIHACIFNMPRYILVVDGWSYTGSSVEIEGEDRAYCNQATGFLVLLPHGTPATLLVGSQRLLINPLPANSRHRTGRFS